VTDISSISFRMLIRKIKQLGFEDVRQKEEILANSALMKKLKRGHMQAELRKGRFVE